MFYIGCHLSAAKGFVAMGKTATAIGANTFQFLHAIPAAARQKRLIKMMLIVF